MNMYGCFIVFGAERAPEVHVLGAAQLQQFQDRCRATLSAPDSARAQLHVYAMTFGEGAEVAFPCWILKSTKFLATKYTGPHQDRVRELAKAITAGVPYGPDEKPWPTDPTDGGAADRIPAQPKPVRPQGGARAERQVRVMEGAQV
jgi:hypothetical protein